MSAALPLADPCCIATCDSTLVENIPGSTGPAGADGTDGIDGISAVTTLTANFTMPAELATASAFVVSTAGLNIGENVFVQTLGTLEVASIPSALQVNLKNLEDTANSAYAGNAAPGTIAPVGSRVSPTGIQGQPGLLAGTAAGGDLKGTYPNPKIALPNSLGAIAVGNGTDANSLAAGTDGQLPAYDAAFPLGLTPKSVIPITGGTNVSTNRLVRLSAATGLPIPITASKAEMNDAGGAGTLIADATSGNARGTDAVDLQINRPSGGNSAVASGIQSVILGGQDNKASALRSVVVGGEKNLCTGSESFIGGGDSNQIDSTQCAIGGGDSNTILGGTCTESFIGSGNGNAITAAQAVIAGGVSNNISGTLGAVLGGQSNFVTAALGSIVGGSGNIVSALGAAIVGGQQATADKYGQRAFSAGRFAVQADCQQSDLIWRISTTDNVITEAFLDGAALRATIAVGRTVAFSFLITGRSSTGVSAAWTVVGAIKNNAGTTALVSAVTTTVIADGTGGTWGVAGGVTIDADNANDALRVQVTGAVATLIRWAIHARLMELSY